MFSEVWHLLIGFIYSDTWLKSKYSQILDPELQLYSGSQYAREERVNFGLFLDSSPDRWGRLLMKRQEAAQARIEKRSPRTLRESNYLLGVFDGHSPTAPPPSGNVPNRHF